jgi:hypothetical protein
MIEKQLNFVRPAFTSGDTAYIGGINPKLIGAAAIETPNHGSKLKFRLTHLVNVPQEYS